MRIEDLEPEGKTFTHGVVVGKFWLPHNGHLRLIKEAAKQSVLLDVFVIESFKEHPRGEHRKRWIEEELKKWQWETDNYNIFIQVVPNLPPGFEDDSPAWADYTIKLLGGNVPDAVFTSEEYGNTWAEALGCEHVCVDLAREVIPVSGTKLRSNPLSVWSHVPYAVRPFCAKKILILGGESTGKTTLAKRLSEYYYSPWVEEYGRTYCERYGTNTNDLAIWPMILVKQVELEDKAAISSRTGLVICDTDLMTTAVWYEDWRGVDEMLYYIQEQALGRHYDVVLYLDHEDVPWIQDGTRISEDKRQWFSERLERVAMMRNPNYVKITGDWENRFNVAVETIDAYLKEQNV